MLPAAEPLVRWFRRQTTTRVDRPRRHLPAAYTYLAIAASSAVQAPALCQALEFEVTLAESAAQALISGRLYVFLSTHEGEPRLGPQWFHPDPFYAIDVEQMRPGEKRIVGIDADAFPEAIGHLPAGKYRAQAVLAHADWQQPGTGPGNAFSRAATFELDDAEPSSVALVLDQNVPEPAFKEQPWLKEIKLPSALLSRFHGHEVVERAGVVLPAGYSHDPTRRYPVLYSIPGFGGSHRIALGYDAPPKAEPGEIDCIRVFLSGNCHWGHHVYADSATNGPRGRMLVEELIPYIDSHFRTVASAGGRLLTGHSSGGWSSLWLQVSYPDFFGGVWSTAPDPVDFHDFQQIDLYADPPQNMYTDPEGKRRPIARRGGQPVLWYDSFAHMDDVLKVGGQLRSFEAVFSPLDDQGLPKRLWNRKSGAIDREVALTWQKYDIRLKLEREWRTLGPKLRGKLHVLAGEFDTYYLEGAVRRLAASLKRLGSDADVQVVEGADHSTLLSRKLVGQLRRQMAESFARSQAATASSD